MDATQWTQFADAPDGHRRRNALELLQRRLPAYEPTRGWSNFEFIALDGNRFDVDSLILTPAGVFFVEIVPSRGHLDIGTDIWLHTRQNEAVDSKTSPYVEARRKADKLHKLLESVAPASHRIPPIQPLVFLSQRQVRVDIDAGGDQGIVFHPDRDGGPSVIDALVDGTAPGVSKLSRPLDDRVAERFEEAFDGAEPEPRRFTRKVGDYELGELIDTTEYYQDYLAEHPTTGQLRRARIFRAHRGAGDAELKRIQEAARREYDLLSELDHHGVLTATRHIGHERRPAVLFDAPDDAVRLDLYMAREPRIGPKTRYAILESIVEAVRFAHEHRVVHRALGPRSVLLVPGDGGEEPSVRLLNWHTGRQQEHETGTRHVSDYVDDNSKVYLAPELRIAPSVGPEADVFGLGTLAYFLFTGRPPATDLSSLVQKLHERGGLRPSVANDNIGPELDDLVYRATASDPADRPSGADGFYAELEAIRDAVVAIEFPVEDPRNAREGDRFGVYDVKKRLGSGSTATALLASDADGRDVVLKIANDEAGSHRIRAEADALKIFESDIIVDFYEETLLKGHRTLVMQYAGNTLLDELRSRSALSLDDQRRFGGDLCEILRDLESTGIFHRDIKPANLAIGRPKKGSGPHRLMLFDFSLHGVEIDNFDVGTRAYRDPFLGTDGRHAWDAYADRYSAALVLHEMVTRRLPVWGSGRSDPAVDTGADLNLEVERFPASIRDGLREFFETALARDYEERFDTADEMAHAWRQLYRRTEDTSHGADAVSITEIEPGDELSRLEVSQLAVDSLEADGITTVEDLLRLPINKLYIREGVGGQLRDELVSLHERLADQFPGIVADAAPTETSDVDYSESPIEKIFEYLKRKPTDFAYQKGYAQFVRDVFCTPPPWDTWEGLAASSDESPERLVRLVEELIDKWRRKPSLESVRDDVVGIVDDLGGIAESAEIARALLGGRGSLLEGDERMEQASAVARAAVETELGADEPRLQLVRHGRADGDGAASTFVATRHELLDLIPELGSCADALATRDTVPSSARTARELAEVIRKAGVFGLANHRLLSIAAAASERAAVSSQSEIYPRGMAPRRALNLCANLLLRRAPLTERGVAGAVEDRYPDAAPLPDRPELDRVLEEAGVDLKWDPEAKGGVGRYVSKHGAKSNRLAVDRSTRASWGKSGPTTRPVPEQQARFDEFRQLVDFKRRDGGFFVLTVEPHIATDATGQLADEFDLDVVSIDRIVIDVLRERADARNVAWELLVETDAPEPSSSARQNMIRFLRGERIGDRVYDRICDAGDELLLTDPGLLGRWDDMADTMDVIQRLRDRTREEGPTLCWLLVPASSRTGQRRPRIAGTAVPVDAGDFDRIPAKLVSERRITADA